MLRFDTEFVKIKNKKILIQKWKKEKGKMEK
jgi:hypothetical protein